MKRIFGYLIFFCALSVYSADSLDSIYKKGDELVANNQTDQDDDELLYEFYSEEIKKLDPDTLKMNPEILFRRGLAGRETLFGKDSIEDFTLLANSCYNDFQFVLTHASKDSWLYKAAQFNRDFSEAQLRIKSLQFDEFFGAIYPFVEKQLRRWATNKSATGKELRQDVFANIKANKNIKNEFYDFVLTSESDPDIVLRYLSPDSFEIEGVSCEDDEPATLDYKLKFRKGNHTYTHSMGF